jgi:hypothetical protein
VERRERARAVAAHDVEALLEEILDAWFAAGPSDEHDDRANVGHLAEHRGLKSCARGARLVLAVVTAGIVVALLASETSGTGAENVGRSGPEATATPAPWRRRSRGGRATELQRICKPTESNPGGTNN